MFNLYQETDNEQFVLIGEVPENFVDLGVRKSLECGQWYDEGNSAIFLKSGVTYIAKRIQ